MKPEEFILKVLRETSEPQRKAVYVPPSIKIGKGNRPCLIYQDLEVIYKRDNIPLLSLETSMKDLYFEVLKEGIEPSRETKRLIRDYVKTKAKRRLVSQELSSALEKALQHIFS